MSRYSYSTSTSTRKNRPDGSRMVATPTSKQTSKQTSKKDLAPISDYSAERSQ